MERGFFVNVIGAIAVLAVAYASQMAYFASPANQLLSEGQKNATRLPYLAQAGDWFTQNVYSKISGVGGQVEQGSAALQEKITEEKNDLQESSMTATKKFLAEKMLQALGLKPDELWCPK